MNEKKVYEKILKKLDYLTVKRVFHTEGGKIICVATAEAVFKLRDLAKEEAREFIEEQLKEITNNQDAK